MHAVFKDSRRHTVREHYVMKAIAKALVSNGEGQNERKLGGRGGEKAR